MEVTFRNVTITIEADTPQAAYDKLCEAMEPLIANGTLEYETDSYTFDADGGRHGGDTQELWGDTDDEVCEECGNVIDRNDDGSTKDNQHVDTCSLYPYMHPREGQPWVEDRPFGYDPDREKGDDDGHEYADPRGDD